MDKLKEISGVGDVTAARLHDAGYDTFEQIASATADELAEEIGIAEKSAEKIIQSAQETLQEFRSRESEMQSARAIIQNLQAEEPQEETPPETEALEMPEEPEELEVEVVEVPETPEEETPDVPEEAEDPSVAGDLLDELVEPIEPEVEEIEAEEAIEEPEELEIEVAEDEVVEAEDVIESDDISELPGEPLPAAGNLSDELAGALIQNFEILDQIAKDIGSELVDIIEKDRNIRQKIIQKALSKPSFRELLISRIVEKLS